MTTYELARESGEAFEHIGDFETADSAYATALASGPGNYAGTRDIDGGHYEEEIRITDEYRVLVRSPGEDDWTEWDG